MDAMEFIVKYPTYIEELKNVIRPELERFLHELSETDPHDLISPEGYFMNENQARGFVWSLFLKKVKMNGLPIEKKGSS